MQLLCVSMEGAGGGGREDGEGRTHTLPVSDTHTQKKPWSGLISGPNCAFRCGGVRPTIEDFKQLSSITV
jgi:hypothetical protein